MMEISYAPAWRRTAPSCGSGAALSAIAKRNATTVASNAFVFITDSVSKMAEICKDHGHAALVGGGDDLRVAHGTAGLNCSGGAGFGGSNEAVRKGKECIAANNAAFERQAGFACFPDSDTAGINAAHLAGANAECAAGGAVNNGIGFHVFDHAPAEDHRFKFFVGRRAFRDHF